jgi:hypothetical protein
VPQPSEAGDFEILVKSFLRFDKVAALVASVRRFYPQVVIRVADDSPDSPARDAALVRFADSGCIVYRLPANIGISAGRNHLLAQVRAPFFVITDDDKVFTRHTRMERLRNVLEADPACLLAAGMNLDYGFLLRYQHGDITRDGLLLRRTLYGDRARTEMIGGVRCVPCRLTPNFFMARTTLFRQHGIEWDARFKLGDGEHAWFFARLPSDVHLYVVPSVRVWHFPTRTGDRAYKRFRYDKQEQQRFSHEFGGRVETTWAYESWLRRAARRIERVIIGAITMTAPRLWRMASR